MMKTRFILFLLFFVLIGAAEEFVFENVSSKDGLSQNEVNCLLQDKQGFMWFGTNDGLNRYDGYAFKIIQFNADEGKELNSNRISALSQDQFQNIWVGSSDRGLNLIRYSDEAIIDVVIPNGQSNLLLKENIVGVEFINNLAIIMSKEKLFFLRITKNGYEPILINKKYFVKTGAFATKSYTAVSDTQFILGTTNGLKIVNLVEGESLNVKIKTYKKNVNINDIIPFRKGYLLSCVTTMYYVNEKFKFDLFEYRNYSSLLPIDDNHVWAGSDEGLELLTFNNPPSVKFDVSNVFTKENTSGGMAENRVTSMFRDKFGILWMGTYGGGVSKLIQRGNKFKLYRDNFESTALKSNNISCFFEDSEQNLWIGTKRDGISYFPKGTTNYSLLAQDILDPIADKNRITSFYELSYAGEKYVIVATDYNLNVRIFNTRGELQRNKLFYALKRIKHPINAMASDEDFLWLGTMEGGLYKYDLHGDSLTRYLTSGASNLASNVVRSLCNDSKNRLWLGTEKGLHLLLPEEKGKKNPHFTIFRNESNNQGSISYDYVLPIIETSDKELWIGTLGGGLNKYIEEDNSFERITMKDGLPNNNIKSIVEDNDKRLWVSTNRGLSCLTLSTKNVVNFSVSDGLQDYEFGELSSGKRANGELLFGGNNGFNSFFPNQIKVDSTMPDLVYTSLQFGSPSAGKNTSFNAAQLKGYIEEQRPIKLSYNENNFTAFFTAIHFFAPKNLQYEYRLLGFEETWNKADFRSRSAKYTNLHAGKYTLQLLASNSDGVWMESPIELHFVIRRAWYKTGLAYAIYLLLVITIFIFFNRFSLIQNRVKHELLMERFEKEKVKELTQLKLRFFTNISHELRTPVTIIKSYFDNVAPNWKSLPEDKVNSDFSVIGRNVDSLLRLISQLLDFRKLEQDKMQLNPTEANIVELIQSAIASFEIVAKRKNISIYFTPANVNVLLWYDVEKMEKIINNVISNAIKYTNAGGEVHIRVKRESATTKIEVKDTGIGIPENVQSSIFERFYQADTTPNTSMESTGIGLSLTKGLVELHHGKIEVESEVGVGSTFILSFYNGNKHYSEKKKQKQILPSTVVEQEITLDSRSVETLGVSVNFKEKRVLVVEDNEDLRNFLCEKLQSYFTVHSAVNGKQGLEKCLELIPDLVLSDIMMPEINGYELCNTLKNDEKISHIPIILLTAKSGVESELHGFKSGADAYVSKPFNLDVLVARIEAILSSRERVWKRIAENPFFKPSEVTFTAKDEAFLQKVTILIEEHMTDASFSVEQLAVLYSISTLNLNKKIKAITGRTSVQFIRLTRLRKAAQLLKNKDSRVSDVTFDVGYSDLQHFRQHFKKEFNLSPSEYKKQFV